MKFTINWIVFLAIILVTITSWILFELYHRKNFIDVPQELVDQSQEELPNTFDKETLIKLYEGKDKLVEPETLNR